jgi:hypothetical protein
MVLTKTMPTTSLPTGEAIPVLGQGTWRLSERKHPRKQEIQALQVILGLGMTLIDTAEMYANGGAEELVGEATAGRPSYATRHGTAAACDRSLKTARNQSAGSVSPSLAGVHPSRRDSRRVRRFAAGRKNPVLGREQLRCLRHGET